MERRAEESVAGYANVIEALREIIIYPLIHSRQSQSLGLKTSLVHAVVRECNAHLTSISPHSILSPYAGESERLLREAFSEALEHASLGKPSVIFIDEIDVLCPPRDSRREQESRIVAQLLTLVGGSKASSKSRPHVAVVASTNRVNAIDPALRRSGRFDAEIEVTTPTEEERFQILKLYSKEFVLDNNVDLKAIAASCNGFVGADLEALCREASLSAQRRLSSTTKNGGIPVIMDDWKHARSKVGPSITRGITVEVPKVSWQDIGGLKDLKNKLQQAVEWPIKHAESFARLGISPICGVLLHGPPGCSKTTLAKAAAHAAGAAFFSLSGADLYSMYVGEGEALLRSIFQRARLAAPSIIFFDEADVVGAKRSGGGGNPRGSSTVGERLLSTLLTEMDGLEQAKGILVLAATNRPHAIDAALMRPGRFDLVLYVPPPDLEGREEILRVHTRRMKLGEDVNLRQLAEDTDLFTGAELAGLCNEAGMLALREDISATAIFNHHFWTARNSLRPALTKLQIDQYASFMKKPSSKPSDADMLKFIKTINSM
ncbi:cell division control protein 48 homolog B isoform X2 [Magnolia sinica]|uniref:cell division control protein 48 homolog B isoform X2 n=1 Tax=Magnolia sinica TaxID=86752 RepID=UPI00265ADEAE|nr:cell division control protein 48 homolog B isoform X2 [Magnolia sinica]